MAYLELFELFPDFLIQYAAYFLFIMLARIGRAVENVRARDVLDDERKISVFGTSKVLEIIWVLSIQDVVEAAAGRGEGDLKLLISFLRALFLKKLVDSHCISATLAPNNISSAVLL